MSTEPGTAMTIAQRATLALGLSNTEATLRELAQRSKSITAVSNPDGREQCHSARMALKNQRVEIERKGKAARDDATKFSKAVIAEERRLIAIIEPEERRLQDIQDAWDAKIEAERQARVQAELNRVAALQGRVQELRGNRMLTPASGSALIAQHISDVESIQVDESFQEMQEAAAAAKVEGLEWLRGVHAAALAQEAEAARLKAEREELTRLRAEAAAREAAERARIAEEERQAKAARDAEDARHSAQLKAQREELEREEKARREAADAEARRVAAERAESERKAREEAEKLKAERAAFEQEQARVRAEKEAEERRRAEQTRIANAKRPDDIELLKALAEYYNLPISRVVEWLAEAPLVIQKDAA